MESPLNGLNHTRHHVVEHGGTCSTKRNLVYGVPQGLVLGPILFLLNTGEINDIIERYGLHSQCYAWWLPSTLKLKAGWKGKIITNDTSMYWCLSSWMASNRLKLNPDKTEFIWIASSRHKHLLDHSPIIHQSHAVDNAVFNCSSSRSISGWNSASISMQARSSAHVFFQIETSQRNSWLSQSWCHKDTCECICHVTFRLLQWIIGWSTWQTAQSTSSGHECGCAVDLSWPSIRTYYAFASESIALAVQSRASHLQNLSWCTRLFMTWYRVT